jgi:hypothetical protein
MLASPSHILDRSAELQPVLSCGIVISRVTTLVCILLPARECVVRSLALMAACLDSGMP